MDQITFEDEITFEDKRNAIAVIVGALALQLEMKVCLWVTLKTRTVLIISVLLVVIQNKSSLTDLIKPSIKPQHFDKHK